jgi:transposase
MAKDNERRTARILFVEQAKTGKEIAELLGVSEKSISNWVTKYGWKKAQTLHAASKENRLDNLIQIVDDLAANRIELNNSLKKSNDIQEQKTIRAQIAEIDNSITRWTKQITAVNKDETITLGTYLSVMKSIFNSLQRYSPELYLKTIEFQEIHINEQSTLLD